MKKSSGKVVRYNKWGYIFLIPFIVVYVIFQLIPLVSTIYNSFFENYMSGLTQVGPKFVGLANYQKLFSDGDIKKYYGIMDHVFRAADHFITGTWRLVLRCTS